MKEEEGIDEWRGGEGLRREGRERKPERVREGDKEQRGIERERGR